MFCPNCGTEMASTARFCAGCGVGASEPTGSPAPATTAPTRSISIMTAAAITFGVIIALCAVAAYNSTAGGLLSLLVGFGSCLWAAMDSSRLQLRRYRTALGAHPVVLFIGMYLLWFAVFPWYLVVSSKARAGLLEPTVGPRRSGWVFVGIVGGFFVGIAAISALLFISAGGAVKGIWQQPGSPVAAAASPLTAQPSRVVQASDAVAFDSVEALLKGEEAVRGKSIQVKARVASLDESRVEFETGDERINWHVSCQPVAGLREGQEATVTATVPTEGVVRLRAPSSEQTGLYELKLSGCRI